MHNRHPYSYDVIIAGAGPVGLFLACELRLADLSVLVLEHARDPKSALKRLPFGLRGLSVPTIEAFYRRGLLDNIAALQPAMDGSASAGAHWMEQPHRPGGHFAGIPFFHDKIDTSQWSYRLPSPATRALETVIRDLIDTRDGATYFAERVWGISLRYDVGGGHPLPGLGVPDFELADGTKLGEYFKGGKGLLLDFGIDAPLQAVARRWPDRITYIAGDAKERLGLSAILVRPDGVVAWASDAAPDAEDAAQTASRWFGKPE